MPLRSIFWNLFGLGLPLLVAALTVPGLIGQIGSERFGFVALAWGLIGYAGALDLGIGRAVTQRIAASIGAVDERRVPDILATAERITLLTGTVAMLLIMLAACFEVYRAIPAESVSNGELGISMALLGLALPMQAITATYRGVNEAYLNFLGINILRIGLGVANFGAPYLISFHTIDLHWIVATLVLSRGLALVLYRSLALRCVVNAIGYARGYYRREHAFALLRFGGWFTVTSIISPLLVQADRFLVGAIISAAAVTVYVIPYEVAIQSLIVVAAVTSVAFPLITGLLWRDHVRAMAVFRQWTRRTVALMFLLTSALAAIMSPLLDFWVGDYVSPDSVIVGQILCLGVFLNSIGAMYFAFLHADGRTRATALLHLAELPFFILALYFLIGAFGIIGAAIAWTLRVGIDAFLLAVIVSRLKTNARP